MTYTKGKRAASEAVTRRRIVEAAVALHREIGPTETSVLAVAKRANVSRPTVYRHFPDERALLLACSGHVREQNPPPSLAAWTQIEDPVRRLKRALSELFSYYAANESLIEHVLRDASADPLVQEVSAPRRAYLADAHALLSRGWGTRRKQLRAAIALAIEFHTWQSLVRKQRLTDAQAVELLTALVEATRLSAQ
jgi:AcrR family transcriptional regulator